MSKKKDLNEIAKIEKAIREKYGDEAIQNPKGTWEEDKEKMYLQALKEFYRRSIRQRATEVVGDIEIKMRKKPNKVSRVCPVCSSYSFSGADDLYMTKFECCFKCYVQYVEGREERWKTGWRPNN